MKWCRKNCHCKEKNLKSTLSDLPANIEAKVTDLCHDRRYRSIIVSLGIQIGTTVKVVRKSYSDQGCMIIKVSGNQLIINKKIASKIIVSV